MRKDRGLAGPILRKCARCSTRFKPSRSDAEFCSDACRQEAFRRRAPLKAGLRLAEDLHAADAAAWLYEHYRNRAAELSRRAMLLGADEDVSFVATPGGIIVLGNYVPWATHTPRAPDDFGYDDADEELWGMMRQTEYEADDARILNLIQQKTQSAGLTAGSSFIRRQHEDGDAAAIRTPVRYVLLLELADVVGRKREGTALPGLQRLMLKYAKEE